MHATSLTKFSVLLNNNMSNIALCQADISSNTISCKPIFYTHDPTNDFLGVFLDDYNFWYPFIYKSLYTHFDSGTTILSNFTTKHAVLYISSPNHGCY